MRKHFYTIISLPRPKAFLFLVFILQLVTCPSRGQVLQKQILTENDYTKWGQLNLNGLNENGRWVSYNMSYENGLDTLFVKNTKSMLTQNFPLGTNGHFINLDFFIFQTTKQIHLVNLKTGKKETFNDAVQYEYSSLAKKILILLTDKEKQNTLLICKHEGTVEERITGVDQFLMDPTQQMILYSSHADEQHTITLLNLLQKNKKKIIRTSSNSFNDMVWDQKGKSLAFMEATPDSRDNNTLFYYNLSIDKIYNLNIEKQHSIGDSLFITGKNHKLKISHDTQKVFFSVQLRAKSEVPKIISSVQLWYANAKWIYPMEQKRKQGDKTYLAVWNPSEDSQKIISNDTLPQVMLTGDQKYAILSSKKQYEPQYAYEGPRDFYLLNLASGQINILLKNHSGNMVLTSASPNGKYIAYFQENNWWIYDISKKSYTNITKKLHLSFYHNNKQHPNNTDIYSNISWTLDGKEIILCDAFDVWAISVDGSSSRRLTHGREIQMQYRLAGYSLILPARSNFDGLMFDTVDLNKGLLLEVSNEYGYSGYYKWSPKLSKSMVSSTTTLLNQLTESADSKIFVYIEQRYDISPRLMFQNNADNSVQMLVQSNPQQKQFYWGKAELIQYQNTKGDSLKGILYYPAQYNSQKKYPMIVYIYEKLSNDFYKYIAPSQLDDRGFNITTFTTQGYFVLLPDIAYKMGEPGLSAVDCVVSATNEMIKNENILPDKIGLIGHSFGGYETNFIITKTSLFAAAIAGSGASDLTSFYLSVGASGKSNIWRFESQQWRMGKSLFDDYKSYETNSPVVYAKNITTPLLLWTGENDKQMNWNQSAAFYLALHRLKKEHVMLVYPKEGHTFSNPLNKKDLYMRMHDWFDYYLKDLQPASWIKAGLQ